MTQSFTWEKAREELRYRRERSLTHGGDRAVEKQRSQGRGLVRERIGMLADPDSFLEVGTMAIDHRYDSQGKELEPTPASYIMGLAEVDGRPVALGGEDFTVSAGHTIGLDRKKGGMGGFLEDLAHEYRIPLMIFVEGVGGGVGMQQTTGHAPIVSSASFGRCYQLLGEVPVIAAGMGACAGGSAGRLVVSHFSIMTRETACVFAGGPPVVERALGHRVNKFESGWRSRFTPRSRGPWTTWRRMRPTQYGR